MTAPVAAPATATARPARLFLALWPDPAVAAAMARCRDAWRWSPDARPQATLRLHLTLHFIGSVERAQVEPFICQLQAVRPAAAQLRFDRVELWRNGIAALCPAALPAPLESLHARLRDVVTGFGWPVEARPLRPHVTLARRASGSVAPARIEPLAWSIDHHLLVETAAASGAYRTLWRSPSTAD